MLLTLILACDKPERADSAPPIEPVAWEQQQLRLTEEVRGRRFRRAILHLHSPYSHDACDGEGLIDGVPDAACLQDLRDGLCASAIELAFVTDHPANAAAYSYEEWLSSRDGDELVSEGGQVLGNRIPCGDGGQVLWMPGIEDELMPVGLNQHVPGDAAERDALYNREDAEAIATEMDAGAAVMLAHTEGRDLDIMREQQAAGLTGVEMFNLHAMFDPDLREDYLGLDGIAWVGDTAPFLDADNDDLQPDLAFLAVYQQQDVSVAAWDALNQTGLTVGIAGTDAHQNVLPTPASDGERFDSYRRMTRWFSNWLLVDGEEPLPSTAQDALTAGRVYTVFEALGTPEGLDVYLDAGGTLYEIGADAPAGTLHVSCPALHPQSPRGLQAPEIRTEVLRDGQLFAEGCGEHTVSEPGIYRVVHHITPHHLTDFLDEQTHLIAERPWIYSNPLRVR